MSIIAFDDLEEKEFKQSFGSFYKGLEIKKGRKVLLYPVSFLVRRFLLVYLFVAGPKELIYQMTVLISSSILSEMIVYTS